jgi:hypothetical protein
LTSGQIVKNAFVVYSSVAVSFKAFPAGFALAENKLACFEAKKHYFALPRKY